MLLNCVFYFIFQLEHADEMYMLVTQISDMLMRMNLF